MLRLWNRSPKTASVKKNGERGRSDNAKSSSKEETVTKHDGEKENGAAKHLESPQILAENKEKKRPSETDSPPDSCNNAVLAVPHESTTASQDVARSTTAKMNTATQPLEDPYEWAYEIWREMGLMGSKKKLVRETTLLVESRLISDIIGGIEDRVSQQHQEKQEELRKQQELQQKKIEKERREQSMAVPITPRGPTVSNAFKDRAHRRMSLPSQFTQKKQQGRNSFANILQQWREKSDDKPNAHFLSPGQLSPPRTSRSSDQKAPVWNDFQNRKIHDTSTAHTSESKTKQDEDSECVSQASRIRAQYFQSRRDTQVSSRGRGRSQPTETNHDGPGRSIRRTRSVSRSRGDFRTAVQQVLENVDAAQSLSRSKSAFFANPMTNQDHQEHERQPGMERARTELDIVLSPRDHSGKSRDGSRFPRSKSAPRSIDRNASRRMSYADRQSNGLIFSNPERESKSNQGNRLRMTDFMNRPADAKLFASDDNCSIPSHVEIDDDDHYSVADSKLTDMRTECESLGPSPAKTPVDSPWTRNVNLKLNRVQQGKDSASRDGQPWHNDIIINRVGSLSDSRFPMEGECFCSTGVFAGKDDLIDFFLPLMGTGCTCGKYSNGLRNPEEPTSLENILRPWQVDFLAGFGIYRGDEMVKAHHRSGSALATALRQYQKKKGISSYRTKSCTMALEIWAKTCKAFVRSIRKQLTEGTVELKLPNTLYILSSFLEKLPVHGNDLNMSSSSSIASGAWSVTHGRAPLALRPYEGVGFKYVTRTESSDVSEV